MKSEGPLVITRNGVPCADQTAALEEFKARCGEATAPPMYAAQAYQHARAKWPEKIVSATEFQGKSGRQCKITRMDTGGEPHSFYGASFEECFRKAQEAGL